MPKSPQTSTPRGRSISLAAADLGTYAWTITVADVVWLLTATWSPFARLQAAFVGSSGQLNFRFAFSPAIGVTVMVVVAD